MRVAAEAPWAAGESNFQSLTVSELVLQGEVGQLTQRVRQLGDKVTKTHEEFCEDNVEDVLFERDGYKGVSIRRIQRSQGFVPNG